MSVTTPTTFEEFRGPSSSKFKRVVKLQFFSQTLQVIIYIVSKFPYAHYRSSRSTIPSSSLLLCPKIWEEREECGEGRRWNSAREEARVYFEDPRDGNGMYARRRDVETVGEQKGEDGSVCGAFRVSCFRDNIVSPPPRQIRA